MPQIGTVDPFYVTVLLWLAKTIILAFICGFLAWLGVGSLSLLTPQIREDHAPYLAGWLKVLKSDRRAIFTAASHAQKAADFLHGLQPNAKPEPEEDREAA